MMCGEKKQVGTKAQPSVRKNVFPLLIIFLAHHVLHHQYSNEDTPFSGDTTPAS
jgi:hypothetical protein